MRKSEKSLLSTINTGYDKPESIEVPKIVRPLIVKVEDKVIIRPQQEIVQTQELSTTIKTGYTSNIIEAPKPKEPERQIISTFSLGFKHDDKPIVPENQPEPVEGSASFPESIKQTVDTGYGKDNKLHKVCKPPKLITYLAVEAYLGEFKQETEKQLARSNLGVYSSKEVDAMVSNIATNLKNNYVTKEEFDDVVIGVSRGVDSTLKSYADYQIPEALFKL